jgi:hypothetical protein
MAGRPTGPVGAFRPTSWARLVTDLLAWTGPQVVDTMVGQDPTRLDGSVSWARPGPVPVWLDQLREVSEQWIHELWTEAGLLLPNVSGVARRAPINPGKFFAPVRSARPGSTASEASLLLAGAVSSAPMQGHFSGASRAEKSHR